MYEYVWTKMMTIHMFIHILTLHNELLDEVSVLRSLAEGPQLFQSILLQSLYVCMYGECVLVWVWVCGVCVYVHAYVHMFYVRNYPCVYICVYVCLWAWNMTHLQQIVSGLHLLHTCSADGSRAGSNGYGHIHTDIMVYIWCMCPM